VIARVGYFEGFGLSGRDYVVETVREQPGFQGVYHLLDRSSNRALSVSFWDDEDAAASAQEAVGEARQAGGHGGPGPDRTETYEVIRYA
jgi:heme-degrading monooxygenase HmoA